MITLKKEIMISSYDAVSICLSIYFRGDDSVRIYFGNGLRTSIWKNYQEYIFSNLLIKERQDNTPEWKRYCYIFNKGQLSSKFWVDGTVVAEEKIKNEEFPKKLNISIHSYTYTRLTMFSVHEADISIDPTSCETNGNVYSWNASDWNFDNNSITVKQEELEEICHNTIIFQYPQPLTLSDAVVKCKKFQGHIPLTVKEKNSSTGTAPYISRKKNLQPIRYQQNRGVVLDFYENKSLDFDIKWEAGQPNGGGIQDGIKCGKSGCYDIALFRPFDFLCQISATVMVRVRGLCMLSKIDYEYRPTSAYADFAYIGSSRSQIFYSDKWKLSVTGSKTQGESFESKSSDLLGTRVWNISNDEHCQGKTAFLTQLNFYTCDDSMFNCANGDCIGIDKRCDGSPGCSDGSDEKDCTTVVTNENYNIKTGDTSVNNKTGISITFQLLNFLAVNDNDGLMKIKFNMQLKWIDSRLSFLNLRRELTKLGTEEVQNIWHPILYFDDIDHLNRNIHIDFDVMVHKNANCTPSYADRSYLYNALVFDGESNELIAVTERRYC